MVVVGVLQIETYLLYTRSLLNIKKSLLYVLLRQSYSMNREEPMGPMLQQLAYVYAIFMQEHRVM